MLMVVRLVIVSFPSCLHNILGICCFKLHLYSLLRRIVRLAHVGVINLLQLVRIKRMLLSSIRSTKRRS